MKNNYRKIYFKQKYYEFRIRLNRVYIHNIVFGLMNFLYLAVLSTLIYYFKDNIHEMIDIQISDFNSIVLTTFSTSIAIEIVILSFSKLNVLGIEKKDAFLNYNFHYSLSIGSLNIFLFMFFVGYLIFLVIGLCNYIYMFGLITLLFSILIIIFSIILLAKNDLKVIIGYMNNKIIFFNTISKNKAKETSLELVKDNKPFSDMLGLYMHSLDFAMMFNYLRVIKKRITTSTLSEKDFDAFIIFIESKNKYGNFYVKLCMGYLLINLLVEVLSDKEYKILALQIINVLRELLLSEDFKTIEEYKFVKHLIDSNYKFGKMDFLFGNIQVSYTYVLNDMNKNAIVTLKNSLQKEEFSKIDSSTIKELYKFIDDVEKKTLVITKNASSVK